MGKRAIEDDKADLLKSVNLSITSPTPFIQLRKQAFLHITLLAAGNP